MKIILLKDVANIGKKFDEIEVKRGYAMNFLIPQGYAIEAVNVSEAEFETIKKQSQSAILADLTKAEELFGFISGKKIKIIAHTNEQGGLYKAIHQLEIAEAVNEQLGVAVPPEVFILINSIKEKGDHIVALKANQSTGELIVSVVSDDDVQDEN